MSTPAESPIRQHTREWLTTVAANRRQAAHNVLEELRRSLEQHASALDAMAAIGDDHVEQLLVNVEGLADEAVQTAVSHARGQLTAAADEELTRTRHALQQELDTARADFDQRQAMLESQLAETERDISTIRQHRDEHAANLHEARTRIDALENESTNARLEMQVASARLEEELQRRRAIEKQLEASRQELLLARAEADARRLEAQVASERIRTLENTANAHVDPIDVLSRLKSGIDALSRVSREQLLTVLVEELRREFRAVGLFAVGQNGFRLWNTQPSEPTFLPSNVVTPTGDSLLSRAATERVAVRAETSPSAEIRGLSDQVIAHAIAIPIVAQQRVLAIVYAENPPDRMSRGPQILIAAEMLVDCLNRRLNQSQGSSIPEEGLRVVPAATDEPLAAMENVQPTNHRDGVTEPASETMTQTYPISRQAARLRLAGSVQLLVDGVASILVDVSTLGAQVVSPSTLRPNRTVRLLLPNSEGGFTCTGRIMWAQLEAPKGDRPAQYRSGIQFLDVQLGAMESFMARHRSSKAPMEEAATLPS